MRIKNGLNGLNKCPKFGKKQLNAKVLQIFAFALQMWVTIWDGKPDYKKNWTPTYCKKSILPLTCESQLGLENQSEREISSYCDKNSAHNVGDKYRWISLLTLIDAGYLGY